VSSSERALPSGLRREIAALWRLEGLLEKALVEPFDSRYGELVRDARERLSVQAFWVDE
jgi:hypothetical protein